MDDVVLQDEHRGVTAMILCKQSSGVHDPRCSISSVTVSDYIWLVLPPSSLNPPFNTNGSL